MKYTQMAVVGWTTAFVIPLVTLGYIPLLNGILVPVFALLLSAYCLQLKADRPSLSVAIWLLIVCTGLFLAIYRPQQFHYPQVFDTAALHEDGKAFSLHINTAKALAGYLALLILIGRTGVPGEAYIKPRADQFATALVFALIVVLLAYFVLGLDIYLKPITYVLAFGVVNLLITCVSEEAFMRLVFQSQLERYIANHTGKKVFYQGVPLLITTLLFVATHTIGSVELLIVFGVAGFLYGLIYTLTRNVFASIATHFTVNIVHFSFLTYPL